MAEYDEDERGGLNFSEFLKMMTRGPPSHYESKDEIMVIFRQYDKERKGYIDINDLRRIAKELKEDIDEETLTQIVNRVDSNMDGKIKFNDFYNVMLGKTSL